MWLLRASKTLAFAAVAGLFFGSVTQAEAQSTSVQIVGVKSIKATSGSDTDEIYFKIAGSGQNIINFPSEPHSISVGGIWKPDFEIGFEKGLEIRLFEADLIGDDDLIGTMRIFPGTSGPLVFSLEGDSSQYTVFLQVN